MVALQVLHQGLKPRRSEEMTPELERLRNMQYLPRTGAAAYIKSDWLPAVWIDNQLKRCQERDAIQATRPEGCFCLGAGKLFARMGVAEEICYSCPEGWALYHHEKTKKEGLKADRYSKAWERCGVPKRFLECRLSTSPVMEYLGDWDVLSDSWFFWGASGVGKTGLAVGWLYERLQAGDSVLFTTVPDLLGEIKATYGVVARSYDTLSVTGEEDVIQKYLTVDSLVLDDLGAEQIGNEDWLQDRLYRIIGGRHDELRPTVFTSNHNIQATGQRIGERITWRIVESCSKSNIIEITGHNLREE